MDAFRCKWGHTNSFQPLRGHTFKACSPFKQPTKPGPTLPAAMLGLCTRTFTVTVVHERTLGPARQKGQEPVVNLVSCGQEGSLGAV